MATQKEMLEGFRDAKEKGAKYVTYGSSDLGMPIPIDDAIHDIMMMDEDQFGDEGDWAVCDENGHIEDEADRLGDLIEEGE